VRRIRFLRLLVLVVGVTALAEPCALAVVVHLPNGQFLGITLHRGVNPASVPGSIAARNGAERFDSTGNLDYHGGPVIHSSSPYLMFWTPSEHPLAAGSELLMERYFSDESADSGRSSNIFGVDRQFTDSFGFVDYRQSFSASSQAIVDTDPYGASGCAKFGKGYSTCLTDGQLRGELSHLISVRGLPVGTAAGAPIYFIVTPPDVNVCADPVDCADTTFCAYHSAFVDGSQQVLYAAIPFFLSADPHSAEYAKACQSDGNSTIQEPNGDLADVAISYMSHEDSEALTDPLGTGYWDSNSGNEDGDNCAFAGPFAPANGTNPAAWLPVLGGSATASTLFDQSINGHPYYTQSEWSNGDTNCEMRPSPGALAPAISAPASTPVGASATFDPGASGSTHALSSATWNFGDGTAFKSGGSVLAPVSHAFTAFGSHTVTLELVDDRGNVGTTSRQIIVGSQPVAGFRSRPRRALRRAPVRFDAGSSHDPDAGVRIISYTWRFGDGSSASGTAAKHRYRRTGTYTVTLTLINSLGLSATSTHQVKIVPGIAKVTVRRRPGGATVLVKVNAAGKVSIGRRTRRLRHAGTVRFTVSGRRLRIRFRPLVGAYQTKTLTIA
jgi:chitodextrinase